LTKRLEGFRVQRIDRAVVALVITVTMIVLAAAGIMSMLNAALLASLAMLATGCLTIERLWQSVDWQTIVIMGAAIGLESAVTGSGLGGEDCKSVWRDRRRQADRRAGGGLSRDSSIDERDLERGGRGVDVLGRGVVGQQPRRELSSFAMVLMSGASHAFINPRVSNQPDGPKAGGYVFSDYAKVGIR
jgi:hypothetical protein